MANKLITPLIFLLVLLLPACATPPPTPTATDVPKRITTTLPTATSDEVEEEPTATETPEDTATPEPTVTLSPAPTVEPGAVLPLPEDSADWQELHVYSTTSAETGQEVEVIIYQGEVIEISPAPLDKNGEVFPNMMTLAEFAARTNGFEKVAASIHADAEGNFPAIEVSAEVMKMVVLDTSQWQKHNWMLGGWEDSVGEHHSILLIWGHHSQMLQQLDEEGDVAEITERSGMLNRVSQKSADGALTFDLPGHTGTGDHSVQLAVGDEILVAVEVGGDNNSLTFNQATEVNGSLTSLEDLNLLLLKNEKAVFSKMGAEWLLIALSYFIDDSNTQ